MPSISRGDSLASQMEVYLYYDNTLSDLGSRPRAPIPSISVSLCYHVFTFPVYLVGETIEIVSGDTVVYTSVICEDGTVQVPDNLVGDFTLVLYVGDKVYSCIVNL